MSEPTDRDRGATAGGDDGADRGADRRLGDLLSRLEVPEHGVGFWDSLDGVLASDGRGNQKAAEAGAEGRDGALGARLRRLPLPAHTPGFWRTVEGALAADTAAMRPRRRRAWKRIVAAAAVAAAATFLAAAWFGLPGGSDGGVGRALAHVFLPPLETTATTPAKVTGNQLVWTSRHVTDPSTGVYDVDVFARDLLSGRSRALSTSASWKQLAAAADGKVAWIDERGGHASSSSTIWQAGCRRRWPSSVPPIHPPRPSRPRRRPTLRCRATPSSGSITVTATETSGPTILPPTKPCPSASTAGRRASRRSPDQRSSGPTAATTPTAPTALTT